MADPKHFEQNMRKLRDVVLIAISPGNVDANDYLQGMANGLLLAEAIFEDREPQYFNADGTRTAVTKAITTRASTSGAYNKLGK